MIQIEARVSSFTFKTLFAILLPKKAVKMYKHWTKEKSSNERVLLDTTNLPRNMAVSIDISSWLLSLQWYKIDKMGSL